MEESRQEDDPMDIEQPEHQSLPSTAYGSPSYSPPEPDEYTKEGRDVENYDTPEEEEHKQERMVRNKAKGKAKVFLPEEENDGDDDDDEEEEEEERAARSKAKGKVRAYLPIGDSDNDNQERTIGLRRPSKPNPLALHPTTAEDTGMDMDAYWADYYRRIRFGDADAAMNETLSSPSPSPSPPSSENDERDPYTTPESRNPVSIRRTHATLDMPSMMNKLATLEQQQAGGSCGRGRGKGSGQGWGLEWKETMTQEKVEHEGWSFYEDPHPSPAEEETGWEVYDASAWEKATENAKEQEVGKVTLKTPSVKRGEGSSKRATDLNSVTNDNLKGPSLEIVRAMRDYQAILRENYLSYEKGDVMKVLYRDSDGRLLDCSGLAEIHFTHMWQKTTSPFSLSKAPNFPVGHIRGISSLSLIVGT